MRGIEAQLFDVIARLEASLDFPDEGYHFVGPREASESLAALVGRIDMLLAQAARGRLVREGAQVAIVGAPNVGKSSLFNALLNANRAIVTAVPGTTRDLLTERAEMGGLSLALIDTAGMRDTTDIVEQEGVSRALGTLDVADLILVVLDRSRPLGSEDLDLLAATTGKRRGGRRQQDRFGKLRGVGNRFPTPSSCPSTPGAGMDALVSGISDALNAGDVLRDRPAITNVRHAALLDRARASLVRAATALDEGIAEEFPLIDLQDAASALQEIRGRRTSEDLLRHIFEKFCIGK